jgi:hypothetical protein
MFHTRSAAQIKAIEAFWESAPEDGEADMKKVVERFGLKFGQVITEKCKRELGPGALQRMERGLRKTCPIVLTAKTRDGGYTDFYFE